MKKNNCINGKASPFRRWKIFLIMKLLYVFILGFMMQSHAIVSQAQTKRLNLEFQGNSLKEVLQILEDQTDYSFIYKDELIDTESKITSSFREKSITEILQNILESEGLTYTIKGKAIVILPKEEQVSGMLQQESTVKGKVTDSSGSPLPGVTVVIKKTTQGTITDAGGNYTFTNVPPNAVLVFSFVGMKSLEIPVSGKQQIDAAMQEETIGLEEVVAIGYGTQRKETLTGSVASIGSEQLATTTTSNLTNMLSGKLPGLRVTQRTSEPGSYNTYYDIRGMGNPLIVVDGFVRDDFNKIDPNEIESISILKDASAAVYGVKAANGVVLITTKKGKAGKAEVSYSGTLGWATITDSPQIGDAVSWMTLTNENRIYTNWLNNRVIVNPTFTEEQIREYRDGTKKSTDWADLAVRDYAPQQQHNLSLSGGTDRVKYFISASYFNEMGLWKSGDLNYDRYNFRTNLSAQISKNLDVELQMDGIVDKKEQPGGTSDPAFMIKSMWMQIPTLSVYANDNPLYLNNAVADGTHPLAITSKAISGYIDNGNKSFQGSLAFNYNIPFVEGLKARFLFGYYNVDNNTKTFKKSFPLYNYNAATDVYTPVYQQSPSYVNQSFTTNYKTLMQTSLSYEKTFFEDHHVKALILFEQRTNIGDNFSARRDLILDAVDQLYAGISTSAQANASSGQIYDDPNKGLVGRLNYDFKSKYLFEFAFRYDGSAKFPKDKRWGFFPSISGGWRLSEENFIKNNLLFVDNLKLRGSWGILGDDTSSSFQFIQGVTYPSNNYYFDNKVIPGTGFTRLTNPDITWYTSKISDLGLEGNLWKNKLNFEIDIFQRNRSDLLATRALTLPNTVGASLPQENLNSDQTRGYELVLGHSHKIRNFMYNISVNLTYARTRNKYQERALPVNSYDNWRNNSNDRWNNVIWGYHYIGQFQSFEEIYSSPIQDSYGNKYLLPGDLKYEDINKDGIIDSGDQVPMARGISSMDNFTNPKRYPEYNYGITINLGWKGFDLSALFQGSANYYIKYVEQLQRPLMWGRNGLAIFMDRWHQVDPLDPKSEWIPGKYPLFRESPNSNYSDSEFWIHNASYLKLKNLEVGYTLPSRLYGKSGISNLRIYVNGFNLYTWSKLDFIDPEHTAENYGYLYPITKNYNIGINVSF